VGRTVGEKDHIHGLRARARRRLLATSGRHELSIRTSLAKWRSMAGSVWTTHIAIALSIIY
jgi:hypothetical protein